MNVENEGVWRNEGYREEFGFLKDLQFCTMTLEFIPVKCKYDENYSTSFQMRHVLTSDGNRGFLCFVSMGMPCAETFRQGTTEEIYNEVLREGEAMQQEKLRQSWLNLNQH